MAENGDVYVIDVQAKLTNKLKDGIDSAEKDADRLGKTIERTQKQLEKLSKIDATFRIGADDKATASITRAKKAAEIFGRTTVRTVIDADDRATKKMQEADKEARKLRNQETKIMLTANDKATKVLKEAEAKADRLTKQAIKMRLEAKDQASPNIDKVNKKANALTKKADKIMLTAEDKASSIIDKAKAKAEALSNTSPKTTLSAVDRASHTIGTVLGSAKSFGGKVFKATLSIIDDATKPLQFIKNQIFSIKGLITGLVAGAATQQLIVNPIGLADQMETATIGFETMFGSLDQANAMMDKIKDFAAKTPFDTSGVISSVQQMMRAGWTEDTVMQDMEKIGNAAAAAGQGTEGVQGIVLALQQMKMAGKLNAQDMMQLTNRGVKGWEYVAKAMGKTIPEVRKMSEDGLIPVDDAIQAIIDGMGEYDGMMDKMSNRTVSGLMSNLKDTFDIAIVEKWGKGLQKGATEGLGKFADWLDEIDPLLQKAGTSLEKMGEAVSKWAFGVLEKAGERLKDVFSSDEFKNAEGFDKIKIVWDKVIGDPLSEWWDTKGLPMFEDYSGKIGKVLGEGLKGGLLALLGVDVEGASSDGSRIGKSFAEGFLEGFEGEKVAEALKIALGNMTGSAAKILPGNEKPTAGSWVSAGILTYLGSKLGLGKAVGGGLKGAGKLIANYGVKGEAAKLSLGSFFGSVAKGTGLMGMFGNAGAALTGTAGATGAAGAAGAAGTATAGTAAIGGSSILGGIMGAAGIGNGAWDLIKGFTADDQAEKEKRLWRGGTKLGMVAGGVGGGAGIGALIGLLGGPVGAGVGALVGAGIGGIGTFLGGNKAGDWLHETFDKGNAKAGGSLGKSLGLGAVGGLALTPFLGPFGPVVGAAIGGLLDVFGEDITKFFTETIPEKWNAFLEGAGEFFTETIPEAVSRFGEKAGIFFTETIPEKWNEFWDGVGEFFTETVPYAYGYVAGRAYAFFTETIPEKWGEFCEWVSEFITETIPEAAEIVFEKITTFLFETVPNKIGELWDSTTTFITESLIPALEKIGKGVKTFILETIPDKIEEIWTGAKNFVTEKLPEGLEKIRQSISTFITETVPGWFSSLWESAKEAWNSFKAGFSAGAEAGGSKGGKAHGGVVQSKVLSWLGEEGPEAVIPLNPARRDRALSLWMQTGQRLGVAAHANGGIVEGRSNGSNILYTPYYKPAEGASGGDGGQGNRYTGLIDESVRAAITARTGGGFNVQVTIQGINFNINAGSADPESIIATIRANSDEFTDMMADMLEAALREAFQNIPKAS